MLSFSFLHRCNVQREQAGLVLMIMREERLCKRLYDFHVPLKISMFVPRTNRRIISNGFM